MTTNESPEMTALAMNIADLFEGDSVDPLNMLISLKPFMPGPAYVALVTSFDMCPIHDQDLDSCADDDTPEADTEAARGPIPLAACRHLRPRA